MPDMVHGMNKPQILSGVKVLDLSRILAAPLCTQSMADMGATVYKIERPGTGDEMRLSPPFLEDAQGRKTSDTPAFIAVNRGKKSLALDISKPEGQAIVRRLAERCDVVVENFKVGDLKRYGLDYESLRALNPGLIYCSVTGFGQDGPLAKRPGYDAVFQALAGGMSSCGLPDDEPGGGPLRPAIPYIDIMTGMVATSAVLGALYHKLRTGQGQHLDIALFDVALLANLDIGQRYLITGELPARAGNRSIRFAPSNAYPCRDGKILIQAGNDAQWKRLCACLGVEEWISDAEFGSNAGRMRHVHALDEQLGALTAKWPKQVLSDRLNDVGVPCGPVHTLDESFAIPHVAHRGSVSAVQHPAHGELQVTRNPMRFSETPLQMRPPPSLGADTYQVLREELGMDDAALAELRAEGVIQHPVG